jgi:C2 domain
MIWIICFRLSVSLKKFQDLPYKGTKPLQYSVLVKIYIYPENKKFPIRYAGSNGNKKSPNPIFEEDYHWNNLGSLENKSLCISVYEKGRQENYDAIGHAMLHLGSAKLQEQPRVFSSSLRDVSTVFKIVLFESKLL